jgi:hypothetical protein
MPFPREDTIMTVHDGRPLLGRRQMSKLSPRLIAVGDAGAQGCKGTNFPTSLYIYIRTAPKDKRKEQKNAGPLRPRARQPALSQSHVPALEAYASCRRSEGD